MIYIAVDESGSFGAAVSGERYFIIGALRMKDIKPLRKLFRQVKRYGLPKRLRHLAEVKASAVPDKFRERLYHGLSQLNVEIHLAVVELSCVPQSVKGNEGLLYLYLVQEVLTNCVSAQDIQVALVLDQRRLKGMYRSEFNAHIRARLALDFGERVHVEIYHRDSTTDVSVQAADFVCWSAYRKYQRGDSRWYDIIRDRIKTEVWPFGGNKKAAPT